ncbi:hypothetical protein HK405_002992, partial [Cladochytrium tenue]
MRVPCIGGHPKNIILLTYDALGALLPVAKLSPAQVSYHFISGYAAKIAGTENGVTKSQAIFSACFGAPFPVWHPTKPRPGSSTRGWNGGAYGTGKRISLKYSRAIIDAIHSGELAAAEYDTYPILNSAKSWLGTKQSFDATLVKLAGLFNEKFAA